MKSKNGNIGTVGFLTFAAIIILAIFVGNYIGQNSENIDAMRYCIGYCDSLDECKYHKGYEDNNTYMCEYFINGTLLTHEYQSIKK